MPTAALLAKTTVQWWTLAWVAGAIVVAVLVITVIVLVSRRPKSMEDGMAEFSRSLQAVAPAHRPNLRPSSAPQRLGQGKAPEQRPMPATRGREMKGETEPV